MIRWNNYPFLLLKKRVIQSSDWPQCIIKKIILGKLSSKCIEILIRLGNERL